VLAERFRLNGVHVSRDFRVSLNAFDMSSRAGATGIRERTA
jgi:hypothetical protein